MDRTPQTPHPKQPNTRYGIRSVNPTNATITAATPQLVLLVRTPPSVPRSPPSWPSSDLDGNDFLDAQRSQDLHDQAEHGHLDTQRVRPQQLDVVGPNVHHHQQPNEPPRTHHYPPKPPLPLPALYL